jgi:hypothetical protein
MLNWRSNNMHFKFSGYFAFFEMISKNENFQKIGKGVVLRAQKLPHHPLGQKHGFATRFQLSNR